MTVRGRSSASFLHLLGWLTLQKVRLATLGEWLWSTERLEPEKTPISLASVGHFACGDHDGDVFRPVDELCLPAWDSYVQIDERNCPIQYGDLPRRLTLLAYRTLLFRISQLRGTESVAAKQLPAMIGSGNRFAVDSLLESLVETSRVMTPLYRHKSLFDRRLTGVSKEPMVHHIASFAPIIPYATSEYQPVPYLVGRGKQSKEEAFASCDVLPDKDATWFVVSYPATLYPSLEGSASNFVRDFTCKNPRLRKKQDLESLSGLTNVYASPDGYGSLMPEDKATVETAIARNVCEKPYEKTLELLKRSPAGNKYIERIEKEIARGTS